MRRAWVLLGIVALIGIATWLLTREPAPRAAPPVAIEQAPMVPLPAQRVAVAAVDAGDEEDDDFVTLHLAGVVVDDGQPVANAIVYAPDTQDDDPTTKTDDAGHFELVVKALRGNEDEESMQLEAHKDDRFGAISFHLAHEKLDLKIELEATGTLRVSLRDPDGAPIRDGQVDAVGDIGTVTGEGDGPPQVDFSEHTDGHGDAVLHVRPDTYSITGSWSGGETTQRTGVKVALGHETHVTLRFRRYSLKGHVLNREGEAVVDAQLELRQHGAKVRAEDDDDELSGDDGVFSYVGLAPGAYELYASHSSEGSGHATLHVPDLDAKVIVESANDITGRVEDEHGAPQPLFGVSAVSGHTDVSTRANEEGRFRLSCPPGAYVVTARADIGSDDREGRVEVKLAAHGHERVTVVVPSAKPLAGQVVDADGTPQPKVLVEAAPLDSPRARVEDFTGKDGRFSFASLSRPEYTLVASGREVTNLDKVVAHPGDTNVKLVVERQPRVEGRVVDAAGTPVKHFFVNGQSFDAADGRFSVAPWGEKRMPLYVDADAVGEAVYAVAAKKHGVTEVGDLAVSTLRMRVTVLDARRRPLPQTSFHFQLDGESSGLFLGDEHKHYFMKDSGDDGQLSFPMFFSDGFSVSAFTRTSGKIDAAIVSKATELELIGGPEWLKP